MKRTKNENPLYAVGNRTEPLKIKEHSFEGNSELMISTGSTLLDLAISGTRIRGGGIPAGILVEVFGPSSSGKTVLLSEIAGAIQRNGGEIQFNDPEARLNKQFAALFDFNTDDIEINEPDTVTQVFEALRNWKPRNTKIINGILTDSLAALSTNMEMENDDGDKMGMRRAKEFSEGLRKAARIIKQNNYIMLCSNQIRVNAGATAYGEQFTVPGGKAIEFYSSLRLRFHKAEKIKEKKKFGKKEIAKTVGIKTQVEVYKNSCDEGYRSADLYIMAGYGIDDIRANLQFIKDFTNNSSYQVGDYKLNSSLNVSVRMVEREGLENQLREEVIDLWQEIQNTFLIKRKKKQR